MFLDIFKEKEEEGYDIKLIALKLLEIAERKNIEISCVKLFKLVFLAHGWVLGIIGKPLSNKEPETFSDFPQFTELLKSLPVSGSQVITSNLINYSGEHKEFSELEMKIIERVIDVYGNLNAFQLTKEITDPRSPWIEDLIHEGRFFKIKNNRIKEYFYNKIYL